jgi:hypothetical protein
VIRPPRCVGILRSMSQVAISPRVVPPARSRRISSTMISLRATQARLLSICDPVVRPGQPHDPVADCIPRFSRNVVAGSGRRRRRMFVFVSS